MASDVVCVLDTLEIERAHYLGYSLGGRLGFQLGLSAPERFVSLELGGASHRPQRGALDRLVYPGFLDTLEQFGIAGLLDAWSRRLGRRLPPRLERVLLAQDEAGAALDHERLSDSRAVAAALPAARLVPIPGEDHLSVLAKPDRVPRT